MWKTVGFAAAITVLSTGVPANAAPIDPYYTLINANSGKCLSIGASSTADGATAIQWGCWGGDDQRWYMNYHA